MRVCTLWCACVCVHVCMCMCVHVYVCLCVYGGDPIPNQKDTPLLIRVSIFLIG